MSPSAAAPNSASQIACSSTSASECPCSPLWCGMCTPPTTSFLPGTSACTSNPWPTLTCHPSSVLQDGLRYLQVLHERDLDVLAAAGHQPGAQSHLLHRARFVGDRRLRILQRF